MSSSILHSLAVETITANLGNLDINTHTHDMLASMAALSICKPNARAVSNSLELMENIFSHLTPKELIDALKVSKGMAAIISRSSKRVRRDAFLEPVVRKPLLKFRRGSMITLLPRPENRAYTKHPLFQAVTPTTPPKGTSDILLNVPGCVLYTFTVADICRMDALNQGPNGRLFDDMLITQPPVQKVKLDPVISPEFGLTIIENEDGVRFGAVFKAILAILEEDEKNGLGERCNDWKGPVVSVWI